MTTLLSIRAVRAMGCLCGVLLAANFAFAQLPDPVPASSDYPLFANDAPLDDITERTVISDRRVLQYAPIRESDIMWEKRLWRVIDTREKMNLSFVSPVSPLFTILSEAATNGDLTVYSTENDHFTKPLSSEDVRAMLYKRDTIVVFDPDTYEEQVTVVENQLNWEDVRRFRLKEVWFFDTRTSTLRVRILGIAPMVDVKDDQGNFRFEKPLFWVYYPSARKLLAGKKAVIPNGNIASTISWEDLLEMRYFSSYIIKEDNVLDRRLEDYLSGVDLLLKSQQIEDELFNREQDMWSY